VVDYAWPELMQPWNTELLADAQIREMLEPDVVASGWLGFPRATPEEIAAAETRLGARLPDSYRQFLTFSNGWRWITPFIEQLWSTSEIERYATRHQDLIDAWRLGARQYPTSTRVPDERYFVYGAEQDPISMRDEYLDASIEISDVADGVLLLNPEVISDDGEWEAWFFAAWLPGATRYRSFWDLMRGERERYRSLR
jgi:hypothetical protein